MLAISQYTIAIIPTLIAAGKVAHEVMTTRREITGYNGSQIDLWCTDGGYCTKPWILVSTPAQGYAAATDINADTSVDGADLAMMLGNWGDAPRHDIPPSDCPLNLINP